MTEKFAKNRIIHCANCKNRNMKIILKDYPFKVNNKWTTLYYLKLVCSKCNSKFCLRLLPNNQFEICEDTLFETEILPIIISNERQHFKETHTIHDDIDSKIKTMDKVIDKVKNE